MSAEGYGQFDMEAGAPLIEFEGDIKSGYNYLLYGDSISKGVVYDEEKGKYVVLEKSFGNLLQDKLRGVIQNAGRFGNTMIKAAGRLQNDILRRKPDIVVIEFGGNDCDFNWEKIAQDPKGNHEPNTDYNLFQSLLRNVVDTLKTTGIVPVLLTIPPIDAERYFKWISRNSASAGERILEWLGSVSKIYWWQERYNAAILSISRDTRTRLIDIRSAFLKQPDFTQFICKDGIHPNEKGHDIIASQIFSYVQQNYRFLLAEKA